MVKQTDAQKLATAKKFISKHTETKKNKGLFTRYRKNISELEPLVKKVRAKRLTGLQKDIREINKIDASKIKQLERKCNKEKKMLENIKNNAIKKISRSYNKKK